MYRMYLLAHKIEASIYFYYASSKPLKDLVGEIASYLPKLRSRTAANLTPMHEITSILIVCMYIHISTLVILTYPIHSWMQYRSFVEGL